MSSNHAVPIVYVVQEQDRWDSRAQAFVPKYDLQAAREHGELVFLLGPRAAPFNGGPIIEELHQKLRSIGEEDSILLVGNPSFIGWAVAVASQYIKEPSLLQWHGQDQKYTRVRSTGL